MLCHSWPCLAFCPPIVYFCTAYFIALPCTPHCMLHQVGHPNLILPSGFLLQQISTILFSTLSLCPFHSSLLLAIRLPMLSTLAYSPNTYVASSVSLSFFSILKRTILLFLYLLTSESCYRCLLCQVEFPKHPAVLCCCETDV